MKLRAEEAAREGRTPRHEHRWVRYSRISKNLQRAVIVAEDSRFFEHEGVDLEEIRKSIEINMERGAAVRGASTITQQLAKNLYLSPSRDPFRKLRELIIARRLEAGLSKVRIFEIYLNVIEWGDGIWGAEAAARRYFGISASALNREQSALLAGAIINPRLLSPARPTRRLLRRQQIILGRMGQVALPAAVAARVDRSPDEAPESPAEPTGDETVVEDVVEPEAPPLPEDPPVPESLPPTPTDEPAP